MESLNQSFGIQMHASSLTALVQENGNVLSSILQPLSEESQEIQFLKHEVAFWKSSHNENLKAIAILESKNSELHQMLQNDIQKLRNEVAEFENETLNHQKLKEIQMFETSQKQELENGDEEDEEKSHLKQIIDELMKYISNMEKKHAADRESFEDVTKILESDIAALELEKDGEKKTFEAKNAEMEQQIADLKAINKSLLNTIESFDLLDDSTSSSESTESVVYNIGTEQIKNEEPLVIKKLVKIKTGTSWKAFLTLDHDETPLKIRCDENKNLILNNVKFSKKLILDGLVTFFDGDPFDGNVGFVKHDVKVLDFFLNVHAWNITDLSLHWIHLRWSTFQKIVASGRIKNLFFSNILITDFDDSSLIQLEDIMEKLPNIEKFRYDVVDKDKFFSISKETSKNLAKLPCFNYLKIFQLCNIVYEEFDPYGFLDFMKKHPSTHFTLSFRPSTMKTKSYLMALKIRMLKSCPSHKKLTFKY